MIHITHNTKNFFEKEKGKILIYGAGNAGYWIGHYMNLCDVPFEGYVDREIIYDGIIFNDHPVWRPDKLMDFQGEKIRIIVSPMRYQSVTYDLLELDRRFCLNAECIVPIYPRVTNGQFEYDINVFLGYFRRKLLKNKTIPTFVSNNCDAGRMYKWLDMPMASPTINSGICPNDFIKICFSPRRYLMAELNSMSYGKSIYAGAGKNGTISFLLEDIRIYFPHDTDGSVIREKWEILKNNIQWENLIFILTDRLGPIPNKIIKDFNELKEKHLLVLDQKKVCFYTNDMVGNTLLSTGNDIFFVKDAIENHFDFLGWLNE